MTFDEFDARLAALLQSLPASTVAELTDDIVAWWNGSSVVYQVVGGQIDGHACDISLRRDWDAYRDWLAAWIDEPGFSALPDENITGRRPEPKQD